MVLAQSLLRYFDLRGCLQESPGLKEYAYPIRTQELGAGKIPQWLRVWTALAKDMNLLPAVTSPSPTERYLSRRSIRSVADDMGLSFPGVISRKKNYDLPSPVKDAVAFWRDT